MKGWVQLVQGGVQSFRFSDFKYHLSSNKRRTSDNRCTVSHSFQNKHHLLISAAPQNATLLKNLTKIKVLKLHTNKSSYFEMSASLQYVPPSSKCRTLKQDSHLPHKVSFICFHGRPSKMMRNAFYFILKALLFSGYLSFCPNVFGHLAKRLDKKAKINFKIYEVRDSDNK